MKVFLFFLLLSIAPLHANQCGAIFDNLNALLCTNAKYIFIPGLAITTVLYLYRDRYVRPLQRNTVSKGDWGNGFSKIGEGYLNLAYVLLKFARGEGAKAEHMMETTLYTILTVQALKYSIHEKGPIKKMIAPSLQVMPLWPLHLLPSLPHKMVGLQEEWPTF